MSQSCECHKIDWLSPLKSGTFIGYRYLPEFGGGIHTQCVGPVAMPCQDKVNLEQMTLVDYNSVCKYIPGDEGSLFPKETYDWILSEYDVSNDGVELPVSEGSPPKKIQ